MRVKNWILGAILGALALMMYFGIMAKMS